MDGEGGAVWFWLKGFLMMSTRISQSAPAAAVAAGNRLRAACFRGGREEEGVAP